MVSRTWLREKDRAKNRRIGKGLKYSMQLVDCNDVSCFRPPVCEFKNVLKVILQKAASSTYHLLWLRMDSSDLDPI